MRLQTSMTRELRLDHRWRQDPGEDTREDIVTSNSACAAAFASGCKIARSSRSGERRNGAKALSVGAISADGRGEVNRSGKISRSFPGSIAGRNIPLSSAAEFKMLCFALGLTSQ